MKIVIADSGFAELRDEFESLLPPETETVWLPSPGDARYPDEIVDAEVVVAGLMTAELARTARRLRLVQSPGAGYESIDLDALPEGVIVANSYCHEGAMGEHIVASLVILRRDLLRQDAELRRGRWYSAAYVPDLAQPRTLEGAVVTFLGFGHIGSATWRLLRAFGCEGIAITRSGSVDAASNGLRWAGGVDRLDDALGESDILVVSIPLSAQTRGMVDARRLSLLGEGELVVNVARGPVIDEQGLYDALRTRSIAGAAVDVWYQYPDAEGRGAPSRLPFGELDNIVMTPHASGITAQTFAGRVRTIASNITKLAQSEPLDNVVRG